MQNMQRLPLMITLLSLLLLAGCPGARKQSAPPQNAGTASSAPGTPTEQAGQAPGGQPLYLVTITPLKLILDPLVGSRGRVEVLLPPGASSHTYEPKPSDAQRAAQATALIWVGQDFDAWAAKLATTANIELLPLVPPDMLMKAGASEIAKQPGADGAASTEHTAGAGDVVAQADPHFFTDPIAVAGLLPPLAEKLGQLDPAGAQDYQRYGAALIAQLMALNEQLSTKLEPLYGQPVILYHPSFSYFVRRYGMRLDGLIEAFPGKEPSPQELTKLVETAKRDKVRAIFDETLLPKQPAESVAEAAGLPVYELDPSCGASERNYQSYREWLLYNADIFLKALKQG